MVLTAMASWGLFVFIYKPSDASYLETTTSHYFKRMSEAGLSHLASYEDCRLDPSDGTEKNEGVAMFGLCRTSTETSDFYYMIAMSPTALYLYSDLEEVPK